MQIKIFRFLLVFLMVFCCETSVFAGVFCKQVSDRNGQMQRTADLRKTPGLKNAKFRTDVCSNSKSGYYCVKDFSDSQVHDMKQAIQIVKDYAHVKNNHDITCHPDYWSCADNDDHIMCATADNSAHYEFVFDDITEKSDAKYKHGIANSYCKMLFDENSTLDKTQERDYSKIGTPMKTVDANDKLICWPSSNFNSDSIYDKCLQMEELVSNSFGYTIIPDSYSCKISFRTTKCRDSYDYDFGTLQVDLNADVVGWLGSYIQRQKGKTINQFKCDLAPRTCETGNFMNPHDDILTCYADGEEILIRFDDLSETKNKWISASRDAMECLDADGIFDGRNCQGISYESCNTMKSRGVDVDWNTDLQACVLNNANSVANIKRTTEVAATVGVAATIATVTIVTGGSTTVVLLSVGATVTATGSQISITAERDKVEQFTSELLACKSTANKSERNCVREKIIWFINHGSNYLNNLTTEQVDAVDKALSRKLGTLELSSQDDRDLLNAFEKSKDKNIIERCTGDALQAGKCVFDAASIILDFLPVTRMAVKAPEAFATFVSKFSQKLPNTAKTLVKLRTSSSAIKNGLKAMEKFDTANDMYTGVSGVTFNN